MARTTKRSVKTKTTKAKTESQPKTESKSKSKETKAKDKFVMNRENFLAAIKAISPGIASNSIVEQSDLVLFDDNRIVSYNDEVAISYPFNIGYRGGVYANELYKLLQKLPSNEIKLYETENEEVTQFVIASGTTTAGFYVVKDIMIPDLGIDEIETWYELPKMFLTGIDLCATTASSDVTRGALVCVDVNQNIILSCDNYRATKFVMNESLSDDIELKIPKQAIKGLVECEVTSFAMTESWLHFQNEEGTIFSVRATSAEYPNVIMLFDVDGEKLVLPGELKESLERAEILASEDQSKNKIVEINIADGKITCQSHGKTGWSKDVIDIQFKDTLPPIQIDPKLLSYILDKTQEVTIGDKSFLFEAKGFSYVVSLIAQPEEAEEELVENIEE